MSDLQEQPHGAGAAVATAEDDDEMAPWQWLLVGAISWGLTGFFYTYIQAFEAGDAVGRRIWWPVAMLYNLAGKWPVIGIGALLGIAFFAVGIAGYRKSQAST